MEFERYSLNILSSLGAPSNDLVEVPTRADPPAKSKSCNSTVQRTVKSPKSTFSNCVLLNFRRSARPTPLSKTILDREPKPSHAISRGVTSPRRQSRIMKFLTEK